MNIRFLNKDKINRIVGGKKPGDSFHVTFKFVPFRSHPCPSLVKEIHFLSQPCIPDVPGKKRNFPFHLRNDNPFPWDYPDCFFFSRMIIRHSQKQDECQEKTCRYQKNPCGYFNQDTPSFHTCFELGPKCTVFFINLLRYYNLSLFACPFLDPS